MLRKRLSEEFGYSLVEVMASIIILSLAILPMVGMFDMGLKSATAGSNYDKSRALANLKLEEAKSRPFGTVRENFPEVAPTTTTYDGSGNYQSAWKDVTGPATADFTNFDYMVEKQYMAQPPTDSQGDPVDASGEEEFEPSPGDEPTGMMRITVTVQWGDGNEYTTVGLVTS